jgi:hypothetical protein
MIPPFTLISPFILQYINEERNLNTETDKGENNSNREDNRKEGETEINKEIGKSIKCSEIKNKSLKEPLDYCWKLKSFIGAPCIKYAYHFVKNSYI